MARSPSPDRRPPDHLSPSQGNIQRPGRRKRRTDHPGIFGSSFRVLAYSLAVIGVTGLVVAVIVLVIGRGNDDIDPTHKLLELTAQDIDPETTAVEKNLLRENKIDARLAATLWRDARRQLSGNSLKEAQRALSEAQISAAVEPLVKQLAADFGDGKAAAFTIWVAEDESQRGNTVDLRLDGVPLGQFSIEQNRYSIGIVERTGQTLRLEITAAAAAPRGAVFRAETATSEAETRHLHAGRTDTWQLVVK
jgi:hypothetical protein